MYHQKDVTLLSINWNQQPALQLMLKSYVKHHYEGEPLKVLIVDNRSEDNSVDWLMNKDVPFVTMHENVGHENAINSVYESIETKYCLLVDTDIEFLDNVHDYLFYLNDTCKAVGELITGDNLGSPIKQRIGAWFWLWDIEAMKEKGVNYFRDPECQDWSYDVGSWQTEKLFQNGFTHHNIEREKGNIDLDMVSMRYPKYHHIGKVSWNLENHRDRITEVMTRRDYVKQRLELYSDIDLKGKFI